MTSLHNNRTAALWGIATAVLVAVILLVGTRRPIPPAEQLPPVTPVSPVRITSQPIPHLELGSDYVYPVTVEGSGSIVLRLISAPTGMTITDDNCLVMLADSAPSTAFHIELEASSGDGSDVQAFDVIPIRSVVIQEQRIVKREREQERAPQPQPQIQPAKIVEAETSVIEPPPPPPAEAAPAKHPVPPAAQSVEKLPEPAEDQAAEAESDRRAAQAAARARLLAKVKDEVQPQPEPVRQVQQPDPPAPSNEAASRFEKLRLARLAAQRKAAAETADPIAVPETPPLPPPAPVEATTAKAPAKPATGRSVPFSFDFRLDDTSFDRFVKLADELGFRLLLMAVDASGRPTSERLFQVSRTDGRIALAPVDLATLKDWTLNTFNGDFVRVRGVPMDRRTRQAFAAEEAKLRNALALPSDYQLLAILPYSFVAGLDRSARAYYAAKAATTARFEDAAGNVRFTVDNNRRIRILSIGG